MKGTSSTNNLFPYFICFYNFILFFKNIFIYPTNPALRARPPSTPRSRYARPLPPPHSSAPAPRAEPPPRSSGATPPPTSSYGWRATRGEGGIWEEERRGASFSGSRSGPEK